MENFENLNQKHIVISKIDIEGLTSKDSILLGDWCYDFRDSNWEQLRHRTFNYHWSNREKLRNDYRYLSELNERLITSLSDFLNSYHNRNYSTRFWRIVIGPWLLNYISVIFDRWEVIRNLILEKDENFRTSILIAERKPPKDFFEFRGLLDNDYWNHLLFSEIFKYVLPNRDFKIIHANKEFKKNTFVGNDRSKLKNIRSVISHLINFVERGLKIFTGLFGVKKRFIFYESGFYKNLAFEIYWKLKTLPFFYFAFRKEIPQLKNQRRHLKHELTFNSQNRFEEFLSTIIIKEMPIAYLEGFSHIFAFAEKEFSTKKIITAYAHWYNEFFKIWAAKEVENNAELIILEHGGSLQLSMNMMKHIENISDKTVCWGVELDKKHTRLPPNKINFKRKSVIRNSDIITLFDYESVRFSYRVVGSPTGPLVVNEHIQKKQFLELLPKKILSEIKIKPKNLGSWFPEESYKRLFGNEIISKDTNIKSIINNSKLIISSYPQTTFSEAMFSGVPSMLLFKENLWEIDPIYSELISNLKKSKIIHTSPQSATNHLIDVYDDLIEWWNSREVVQSRKLFEEFCNTISENPSKSWVDFLKGI